MVGIVAEIPTGALADRFSRRTSLVVAGLLQAAGYALWVALPGFPAFAAGFVLWGLGGSFVSGALQALLYDGLVAHGAQRHYAHVYGQVEAVGLLAQLPAAAAATVLFSLGDYELVGWVSVATCLGAAALASRLPEPPRSAGEEPDTGYLPTLRAGVAQAFVRPVVRRAVLAVALLTGLDALEEYFPLLAQDWGVATGVIPLAMVAIPFAGAVGAALGGRAGRLGPVALGLTLGAGALLLAGTGLAAHPAGLAGVAVFYGLYRMVLVVADARLQDRIEGPARATVTSVAGLATDLAVFVVYAAWVLGAVLAAATLVLLVAAALPYALRAPRPGSEPAGAREGNRPVLPT